ncbi:hypothetical protein [uncultured Corynebacterium sp.]|uniref:DUF7302 family protein n=1 Tax=uncultured Corynebacterium sp. TaxID=159447 RepID=UPI0026356F0C|nr:hypothetical protein [uncultured Corynebacterium sp.]
MKLVHKINGGAVEVGEAYGERLLKGGLWKRAVAEKPKRAPRRSAPAAKDSEEV